MKSAAEEAKARSSMTSTFGSVMNPDMRDFKLSLDQVMKQKKKANMSDTMSTFFNDQDDDNSYEDVSFRWQLQATK